MSTLKDYWHTLKADKRSSLVTIAAIAAVFSLLVALNLLFIFRITAAQTERLGQMQLDRIRTELQETTSAAERLLLRVAVNAEQMLARGASPENIRAFFEYEQHEQEVLSQGECFNVYIANSDWAIIPKFDIPADYHAVERTWYKGAAQSPGKIFISEPYVDAAGHGICFTIAMMLSDKKTVVALDYNFSAVQKIISKMDTGKDRTALIATADGMIIGYSDMSFVGEHIAKKLPEYQGILSQVTNTALHESFEHELDGKSNTIFSGETDNGWYMILCVDSGELYRDDYRNIMIISAVNLLMILVIVAYYLRNMKNRLDTAKALRANEKFLSRLSKDLRAPLQRILKFANADLLADGEHHNDNAARVRDSAMQMSDMLDNIFSYSTIVNDDDHRADKQVAKNLKVSEASRTARIRIIGVLTIALVLRLVISVDTNIGWGDTKMTREAELYEHRLSDWMIEQQTILSMFDNFISENPDLLSDYQGTVDFLNSIAKHYPELSACYVADPKNPHQVIMNNGWQSLDPNWRVDLRPWYIETIEADAANHGAFTVSTPYIDSRTGNYCVTVAKVIRDKQDNFIGVFGIDFYIDRLIQILSASYSADGYAFLVDRNGIIINHPNFSYQMTAEKMTDIATTEYRRVYTTGEDFVMQDYRGAYMTCVAKRNDQSNFTVVVVNDWNKIYGQVILYGVLFIVIYLICVGLVVTFVENLLKWQNAIQRKLKDAAKAALTAGQAKSQFLAQMSHEIRTPINAILGMNEMILRESNEKDIHDYAANIQSASRTLLSLINSILDFSKIEDGKMEIIPNRYETLNMIDDLVNMIYERAAQKNLSLITKIDPDLPKVLYGDDLRVKQVITNLLTNAVKYTKQGTVTLTIGGTFADDNAIDLHVSVADTGIGIRAEDIDKLFQSFRRLDEEKNKNIEGTGLGISIVKELLRMMNSRLDVKSVYGAGSDFSFTIRQKILDKTPIGTYGEHHAKGTVKRVETTYIKAPAAKILAVDDTPMNLKVIKGLLKRNEIVPDLVDSGTKCLELAAQNFYHIIFLDHMMPDPDGVKTLKQLKKINLPAETKIVVLTANAVSGARERYLSLGFDDYLSKPIDADALENILSKYLPETIRNEELGIRNVDEPAATGTTSLIDMKTALANCMDSEEFFLEMAADFVAEDKTAELDAALAAGDLNAYRITVHALKGTALVVGAVTLSESAKASEFAARDGQLDTVRDRHGDLMATYKLVREELTARLADVDKTS